MKRFKLFLSGLSLIFSFNSICSVYANNVNISTVNDYNINSLENELSEELNLLNEKYNEFDFKILNEKETRNSEFSALPLIELNSLEELEKLLNDFEEFNKEEKEITYTINTNSKTISDSFNFQWNDYTFWEKLTGPIYKTFVKKNVTLFYDYIPKKGFTNLRDVKSYFSDYNIFCTWEQLGYSHNIYTDSTLNDSLRVKVEGRSLLGVTISYSGVTFNIGMTTPETWTVRLKLV